jgi:glutathione peroxidase
MKTILFFSIFAFSFSSFSSDIYKYHLKGAKNKDIKLASFKGKAVLIVNIATRCGHTAQLDGLEKVYQEYKDKGFTVIGVPSNDFGGQTPENNEEVANFCKLNYGVTFPLTKKILVKGDEKSNLYKYLIGLTDGSEIAWNFTKFLFDKKGNFVKRYEPSITPADKNFIADIKKATN